jgi:pimeloyl-ACP methyl ester carboxylesterase
VRYQAPAPERKYLSSARTELLEINQHIIATYSWGQTGPSVLLVHGWSGRGSQLGAFAKPLLDAGYHVIAFDAPAHGRSSGNHTNIYEIADVIVGLQSHYGKFDSVITHSFGGPCTALAMKRGFETRHMVSLSPPSTTRKLVEKFLTTLHIPAKAGQNMKRRFETQFGANIWDDVSMVNSVRDIVIPGLLIHDSRDEDVPWQEGQAIAEAWSNARFVKTSGLGHRRILRDKAVIESAIRFLNVA